MSTDRTVARTSASSAPSSWGLGEGQAIPWEYAPAPEARDIVTLQERYGLFVDGRKFRDAAGGATFTTVDPSTELPLAEVAKATAGGHRQGGRAPPSRAGRRSWGNLPGRERAKYLFRIARIIQERSREFAVLESMDSGKPIKESARRRRAARRGALLVLRRLGGQARVRVPGPPAPCRSASPRRSSRGTSRC